MLAVGSSACPWVAVTAVEDAGVPGRVVVGCGVVSGLGVDHPAVLSTGWLGDTWVVGLCAWGLVRGARLAVELGGVCFAGPGVLLGWLALVAGAAWAVVASVATVAAGGVLLGGPPAGGGLRDWVPAVAVDGVCRVVVGTGDRGALEASPSVSPSPATGELTFVLFAVSAET